MILAVLQARTSSTRLPGKVLRPLLGEPMIGRHLERLARCTTLDRLVVATSVDASDDPLAAYCESKGVVVFRGALEDVLGRFGAAVAAQGSVEHVVRLTADCPLADPAVIDACVRLHLERGADYTSNTLERTYPDGLDVEVVTANALAQAVDEATEPFEREHVTPFFYRRPDRFRIVQMTQDRDLADRRWTVDTAEDFAFVEQVYAALFEADPGFGQDAVLALPFERIAA
ncbi:cytidylyltransferase domain-containing protein [Caulobacter sp. 17J80-11]|uniref:cytidylyltransferase domain-containing protein n=1 Tax=Caulobacter sp. 17J80-11 TaxID=2763502 RepID=UPI001653BEAA|nr:glycosyltransferase family protein [Caulobacter sp. 17J80-11]MBC6983664.1 glycosyltransferase family protein [Caulobacter sp. 17J80-11]